MVPETGILKDGDRVHKEKRKLCVEGKDQKWPRKKWLCSFMTVGNEIWSRRAMLMAHAHLKQKSALATLTFKIVQ